MSADIHMCFLLNYHEAVALPIATRKIYAIYEAFCKHVLEIRF